MFEVTIEIESGVLSLSQISSILNLQPSIYSHSVGMPRFKDMHWKNSVWKSEIIMCDSLNFMHITEKLNKIGIDLSLLKKMVNSSNLTWALNIGCFSKNAYASLCLSTKDIYLLSKYELNLFFTVYSIQESEQAERESGSERGDNQGQSSR